MSNDNGLICAYRLDGQGGGESIGWDEINAHASDDSTIWIHLDRSIEEAGQWLETRAGLEEFVCEALLEEDTRPRFERYKSGALLILRGVNLNPGADVDEMISVRLWIEPRRIISLRLHHIKSIQTIRESLESGDGPVDTGGFVITLIDELTAKMDPVVNKMEKKIDEIEDAGDNIPLHDTLTRLSELRLQSSTLRRYIAPQRDAVYGMLKAAPSWLDDEHRAWLRESVDDLQRIAEDLIMAREHADILHNEIEGHLAGRMNKTMYLMSMVAAIFLPLGLLTGLLGINVGGMPGVESNDAFWVVCIVLLAIAGLQIWLFRKMNLL